MQAKSHLALVMPTGIVPQARIIGFPRGAGTNLGGYLEEVAIDAVGLDWTIGLDFARCNIQPRRPVQGNLDPLALLVGGEALKSEQFRPAAGLIPITASANTSRRPKSRS